MELFISVFSGGTAEPKGLEEGLKIHEKNGGWVQTTGPGCKVPSA